jgi:chromosome segregation ATPase
MSTVALVSGQSLQEAKAAREQAQKRVDGLFRQSSDLAAQIRRLADEAAKGRTVAGDLNKLAKQKSEVDLALLDAEEALETCEQKFQQVDLRERFDRLDVAISEAASARKEAALHIKQSCLELGRYIRAMNRATAALNAVNAASAFPSVRLSEIRELDVSTFTGNIIREIIDETNLAPDLGAGWRQTVTVQPLHPKF